MTEPTPTTTASDTVLDELLALLAAATEDLLLPVDQSYGEEPDRAPLIMDGVVNPAIDGQIWPVVCVSLAGGDSGSTRSHAHRTRTVRIQLGVYTAEPADYRWVARLADIIEAALRAYSRAHGKTDLLAPIQWADIPDITWPNAAAQMHCTIKLP